MKQLIILIWLLMGVSSVSGQSSDPRAQVAAKKLLSLFKMDQHYEKSMEQVVRMSENIVDSQQISEEEKKKAKELIRASIESTVEEVTWEKMKGVFIDIYAETFTSEELEGIITFYETPIGKKFLEKQPQLTTVTLQKMQELVQGVMPEIQRKVREVIEKK
jgi:hypothetical protein